MDWWSLAPGEHPDGLALAGAVGQVGGGRERGGQVDPAERQRCARAPVGLRLAGSLPRVRGSLARDADRDAVELQAAVGERAAAGRRAMPAERCLASADSAIRWACAMPFRISRRTTTSPSSRGSSCIRMRAPSAACDTFSRAASPSASRSTRSRSMIATGRLDGRVGGLPGRAARPAPAGRAGRRGRCCRRAALAGCGLGRLDGRSVVVPSPAATALPAGRSAGDLRPPRSRRRWTRLRVVALPRRCRLRRCGVGGCCDRGLDERRIDVAVRQGRRRRQHDRRAPGPAAGAAAGRGRDRCGAGLRGSGASAGDDADR